MLSSEKLKKIGDWMLNDDFVLDNRTKVKLANLLLELADQLDYYEERDLISDSKMAALMEVNESRKEAVMEKESSLSECFQENEGLRIANEDLQSENEDLKSQVQVLIEELYFSKNNISVV